MDNKKELLLKKIAKAVFSAEQTYDTYNSGGVEGFQYIEGIHVTDSCVPHNALIIVEFKNQEEIRVYDRTYHGMPGVFIKIYQVSDDGTILSDNETPVFLRSQGLGTWDEDIFREMHSEIEEVKALLSKYVEMNDTTKTYFTLRRRDGEKEDIYPEKFPSYAAAFDMMCNLYQFSLESPFENEYQDPKMYGIYRTVESTWNGHNNSMTQPVWS